MSRNHYSEVEDGMGFSGLAPSRAELEEGRRIKQAEQRGWNAAIEAAAAYHDKAAADCDAIAQVNTGSFAADCMTNAADHRISADEIRAMKRA